MATAAPSSPAKTVAAGIKILQPKIEGSSKISMPSSSKVPAEKNVHVYLVEDDSDQDVDLHAARKRKRPATFAFDEIKDDDPSVVAGEGLLQDAEGHMLIHGVNVEAEVLAQHAAVRMNEAIDVVCSTGVKYVRV